MMVNGHILFARKLKPCVFYPPHMCTDPSHRHVLVLVGKPIFHKEGETLDEFHARYIEYVKALYNRYAPVSPRPQQKLVIV